METVYAREIASRQGAEKLVLVASRRTDMPAFYTEELIRGLREGIFHPAGLMQPVRELRFTPEEIHSVGLWSQDFSEWLKARHGLVSGSAAPRDTRTGSSYKFWYRFTILPDDPVIKPKAPPVSVQLEQAARLLELDGPGTVTLCVDPLLYYRKKGTREWTPGCTDESAGKIFQGACRLGLKEITLSFIDYYKKVERRAARSGIEFMYPDLSREAGRQAAAELVRPLAEASRRTGIAIRSCCESFPGEPLLLPGACVDGRKLNRLFGPGASEKQDRGQRKKQGCLCTLSVDVGRYIEHGTWSHHCFHDCPQCYARY